MTTKFNEAATAYECTIGNLSDGGREAFELALRSRTSVRVTSLCAAQYLHKAVDEDGATETPLMALQLS
jgi:hypothetical protein